MKEVLNNREIIIVFWTVVIAVILLRQAGVGKSVKDLLKQFFNPKIIIPLVLSTAPILLTLYVMESLGLWDISSLKETVIWAVGAGIVMFFNSTSIKDGKELLKKSLKDSLKLVILVEFLINFYVFHIIIEFFLVPIVTILVLTHTLTGHQGKKEYEPVRKLLGVILGVFGLFLFSYAIYRLINNTSGFFTWQNLKLFLLPIILTIAYIPSIYLIALYSSYESLFSRIDFFLKKHKNKSKVKIACFKKCLFSVRRVNEITPYLIRNLMMDTSQKDALTIVQKYESKKKL